MTGGATAMQRLLVLVRHGQSAWNLRTLFTGWRDPDLTERGGFGAVRTRVAEALDTRIDTYVEDLLEQLHSGEAEAEDDDLRRRLEAAAGLLAMVRDPSAAQIVRRRMAAAA